MDDVLVRVMAEAMAKWSSGCGLDELQPHDEPNADAYMTMAREALIALRINGWDVVPRGDA